MSFVDYPEDFTTVTIPFTTHDANGAPVAPSSAFEAADVAIYKNGSATQKTSTNGLTMTSPFDSNTGCHMLVIDTSNDTGDAGFWTAGAVFDVYLAPDETVNSQTVGKWIGKFGLALTPALRPTTAGRTLDVTAGGEAGIDWANIGSPTTTQNLSGTSTKAVEPTVAGRTLDVSAGGEAGLDWANVGTPGSTQNLSATTISALSTTERDAIANALLGLANGIETGYTVKQALRLMAAFAAGKVSGAPGSPVFRSLDDSANRISGTADTDGNRTAVTHSA